jgi:hypothetical protein
MVCLERTWWVRRERREPARVWRASSWIYTMCCSTAAPTVPSAPSTSRSVIRVSPPLPAVTLVCSPVQFCQPGPLRHDASIPKWPNHSRCRDVWKRRVWIGRRRAGRGANRSGLLLRPAGAQFPLGGCRGRRGSQAALRARHLSASVCHSAFTVSTLAHGCISC